jgi:pSer/pThr/pTyr-binding forkhead associated (FHA) protein
MDSLVLKEIALHKERVTIGRHPSNDIQIDNLAISGEHAAVITLLEDSFLEDLNSTHGTLLNGQPVKRHLLKDGDVVELGKYKLKYLTEAPPGDDSLQASPLPETETEAVPRPEETREPSVVPAATARTMVGVIQVLNGANAGRKLELSKDLTTLGKPGRQVAVIARRPQGYFITHVEGAGVPTVNGRTLDVQAHPLEDHDVIEITGIKMEFFLEESGARRER